MKRALVVALAAAAGCSSGPSDVTYPAMGSISQPSGKGSFRFGVATAATQIEDMDVATDWYAFTESTAMGGVGSGAAFVGDAVDGYTLALDDIALLQALHVDSYRFSIEWARVEPTFGNFDEDAMQHYDDVINALVAAGIKPLVTLHHFSNPLWVADPRVPDCKFGVGPANLCGLADPTGGPMVIDKMAVFAGMMAARYGDRVDEWGTVNEPVNYLLAAYGVGQFPPALNYALTDFPTFMNVVRNYLEAHARMYAAIKAADTIDADGDGVAASVGMSLSVAWFEAANGNVPSKDPADVAARDRIEYVYHHLVPDSILNGTFDADLDGTPEESHPTWAGKLDWLGLQYYSRIGVTGSPGFFPVVNATPCFKPLDFGACLPPKDPTYCVPQMGYEFWAPGLYNVLEDFGKRYPTLPLLVTEAGIATDVGARRSENIVRILQQIDRARQKGIDVRGYYHWSLMDNFEWAEGFGPKFGLYSVDLSSYARTPTDGANTYMAIAGARELTVAQQKLMGGDGPMTADDQGGLSAGGICVQVK
ncbi:MAG TPA: family 1 glycosylhydrolase [Polyangia bacterium]|jgi:beta-glucosidase